MKSGPALIAGFGSIGQRHYRNLVALGQNDFIFFRNRLGALDASEIEHHPAFDTLDGALERKPWITIISNPTALHVPVALAAARAGSHLLIEKPVSHTIDGLDDLAAVCDEQALTTMIGCQWRFHPLLVSLRSHLQAGRLGDVFGVRVEFGEFLPSWHPWEDHRKAYSARGDLGGGVVLTLIHPLDYLYWIFGDVGRVHASMRPAAFLGTSCGDDLAEVTLEFSSGVIGQVHLDYVQRTPHHSVRVLGERGGAQVDLIAGTLGWEVADADTTVETVPEAFERNTMFLDEMKRFLADAQARRPSAIPLADGRRVLEIALEAKQNAMRRSS